VTPSYSELMDTALRELSDQIDQATQRLLDTARIITEPDLRAPSLLPGWTRAHVLAHVARNADAMRNVLAGVRSGQDRPGYTSPEAREADIERDAGRQARELAADLADSAMALRTVARQLPGEGWQVPVRMLDPGARFPAAELLTRRLVEVELHHGDLGAGYGPADWPAAFAAMELGEPMRTWRQDRLSQPAAAHPATAGLTPPRPPAPWRPGRPLPGSWLGTRS
jgi:maleylpyruvate isomerase